MEPTRKLLLCYLLVVWKSLVTSALPSGFIAEVVSSLDSVTGTFAPNPRNDGKPMLLLVARAGWVSVVENPDASSDSFIVLDLADKMCTNTERGLQTIAVHPNFETNLYIYVFYNKFKEGCLADDSEDGPWNVVERFVMDPDTLMLDYDTREEIWRSTPLRDAVHNGGALLFGNDGKLYITTGDGGEKDFAQDLSTVHGSLIRINDDGTIPYDNPFTIENGYDAYNCKLSGGKVPANVSDDAVCSEIYAYGLRNPFRVSINPNVHNKTLFAISDVGARTWEELNYAGTDYAGKNYGYKTYEGPCMLASDSDCPIPEDPTFVDPFHYYLHREDEDGCVSGSVFVPEGIWPEEYKFLFADFVFLQIYSLIEDPDNECRTCSPPVSRFRNETFFQSVIYPGDGKNEGKIIDMFFGPYNDTQALYVVKFGTYDTIVRIRYTGIDNEPPLVGFTVEDRPYDVGESIQFDGTNSSDPEGRPITYEWYFGDGGESTEVSPTHVYDRPGQYTVTLFITDDFGVVQQKSTEVVVGDPPTASILLPLEGTEFSVGQVLEVVGAGFDANGTAIEASNLVWEVRKHHDDHYHPFLDPTNGTASLELYPAPEPEDFYAANNSYLEIILTVADDYGLPTTVTRLVQPKKVTVGIDSNPKGLEVRVEDEPVKSFQNIVSWQDHTLRLTVEDQPPFVFTSWADGNMNRERSVKLNFSNPMFLANFCTENGGDCSEESVCCSGFCEESACVAEASSTTISPTISITASETPPTPSDTEEDGDDDIPSSSPTSLRGGDDSQNEPDPSSSSDSSGVAPSQAAPPLLWLLSLLPCFFLWRS